MVFEALQPKKVGWVFRPRFTIVVVSGIEGKEVPFTRLEMELEVRLRE